MLILPFTTQFPDNLLNALFDLNEFPFDLFLKSGHARLMHQDYLATQHLLRLFEKENKTATLRHDGD